MPNKPYKKPTLKRFKAVLEQTGGHLTNTAAMLGCNRSTLREWAKNDPDFADAIAATRMKILDNAIQTAQIVAFGIPVKDPQGRVVGWEQPPDPGMLKYLMSTLGREEEFGEEMTLRHTVDEGVDIYHWIDHEIEEKQRITARQGKP